MNPRPTSSSNTSARPSSVSITAIPIEGSYIPPSRDTKGTIFQRIEKCKKLKNNMK